MRERSILGGRSHERPPLSGSDCFQRGTERVAGSGFHLHHHELRAAPADQVELATPGRETRSDKLITTLLEQVGGGLLSGAAEL
jgi:hypothetical protein